MNSSVSKVVRRMIHASPCVWSKTASKSFSSIISQQNTASFPSNLFTRHYRHSSTSTTKLAECLQVEVSAEMADDDIDQEYVDSRKQISKLFTIADSPGEGKQARERKITVKAEISVD